MLKSAISVVDQVDISQVIDDPTSILENKELDVTSILTDLGNLIDFFSISLRQNILQ